MSGRGTHAGEALERLRIAAGAIGRSATFMEVCGTHTMSAFRTGLRSLMPDNVRLLSGPGCPVCVTAQGDIDQLIELADSGDVTVCTYGDMLRVPGRRGSLEAARSRGADVRALYSIREAVALAAADPSRQVVFAAVGFETTAPATAAAVLEARRRDLDNFSVLASHKLVVPAMAALLDSGEVNLDGFLCPGHVSVIIGADAFRPIVEDYGLPCVVAGFEAGLMAAALAELAEAVVAGRPRLVNHYPVAVTSAGNEVAQTLIDRVFARADVRWRGLGLIAQSGLVLRPDFHSFDAPRRFGLVTPPDEEPAGCRCGEVLTGRVTPPECALFGAGCTPVHPVGPCMVSSEGTCQAYYKYAARGPGEMGGRARSGDAASAGAPSGDAEVRACEGVGARGAVTARTAS